jgi:uncharacterized protein with ParB-like and HNH nuclease domain
MATKKITAEDIQEAEKQLKELKIPYDYDSLEYPIEVLLYKFKTGLIKDGASIYIPNYQRNFVWAEKDMCRFIESLFLGVPIQPIFGSLDDKTGFIEVIDGSQRIRTINEFVNNGLILKNLKKLDSLNGFSYTDLDPARQNKFQTIGLRFQIISDKATEEVKQDIFYRINTSGLPASPSEIRKGSFSGDFYNFIIECSKDELFEKLAPLSKDKIKRGDAQELVLRFFAYTELGTDSKTKGQGFLNDYVEIKNKDKFDKEKLKEYFKTMLSFVEKFFPYGFAKSANSNSTPRVRFEAISVGCFLALQEKSDLKPAYMDWLDSMEFDDEVASDGSNNTGRLTSRVNFVKNCLLNVTKKSDLKYEKGKK